MAARRLAGLASVLCVCCAAALSMAEGGGEASTNAPCFVDVSFRAGAPALAGAAWVRAVTQAGAGFTADGTAWHAGADAPWGVGRLVLEIDRDAQPLDLAMTLVFESRDANVAIQLLDATNRVVALDLFSNVAALSRDFHTDTLVIPLTSYPDATRIVVRRLAGDITVHGALLVPAATAIESGEPLTLLEMARLLGDPLSPSNPLVATLREATDDPAVRADSGGAARPRESSFATLAASSAREIVTFLNSISVKGLDFTADDYVRLAGDGELEMVNLYLKAGMPVTARDRRGVNVAVEAALKGRIKVLDFLFSNGMPVDEPDTIRRTPLFAAAQSARADVATFLLMHGANPNVVNAQGASPLWFAVYWSCDSACSVRDQLLRAGADINFRDPAGVSVLLNAIRAGHVNHVQALVEQGADLAVKDNEGRGAMDYALYRGNDWIGLLLQRAGAGRYSKDDLPLDMRLIAAAKAGDYAGCERLMERGAKPNARDLEGKTALIWAAHNCPVGGCIEALLEGGADPNLADNEGRTALIEGSIWASAEVTQSLSRLLDAGAQVDHQDSKGTTALMVAAHGQFTSTIQLLLQRGANPDIRNRAGKTARDVASGNANELNEMILKYSGGARK